MQLTVLPETYSILQMDKNDQVPSPTGKGFFSITQTTDEVSIVCESHLALPAIKTETDWRIIKLVGSFDCSCVGVLASIANPLAAAKISIFAISSFSTDYVLIKAPFLDMACQVLQENGFYLLSEHYV